MTTARDAVTRYHDGTKHHFHAYARSLGYLDWASQPRPFRSFEGAPIVDLYPGPAARPAAYNPAAITLDQLRDGLEDAHPVTAAAIGDVLRHSLGLSAWKAIAASRWALRVNPSSGNLHPTEAYVICGSLESIGAEAGVYHYAADRHALEQRCRFDAAAWDAMRAVGGGAALIALTSIHWRESWKYGERAFRYCQHDLGHAMAAVMLAAALAGWRARVLPEWPHAAIASLTGIDRDDDFFEAEREEPGCVIELAAGPVQAWTPQRIARLSATVACGVWTGRASQLSEDHVHWSFIDGVANATVDAGRAADAATLAPVRRHPDRGLDARSLMRQRRSAVAFDGRSTLERSRFIRLLDSVLPADVPPWSGLWWRPAIHLLLFVHRVDDVAPGIYALPRLPGAVDRLRAASHPSLLWERADAELPLFLLTNGDTRSLARNLSCHQDIAADGFFSLGMLAEFDASLERHGASFYRQLFWECGCIGQVLYLEAEAAGARATGIGCFFDDPVHQAIGLRDHTFQSLYHFTIGVPVEDTRLTVEPGYAWEAPIPPRS